MRLKPQEGGRMADSLGLMRSRGGAPGCCRGLQTHCFMMDLGQPIVPRLLPEAQSSAHCGPDAARGPFLLLCLRFPRALSPPLPLWTKSCMCSNGISTCKVCAETQPRMAHLLCLSPGPAHWTQGMFSAPGTGSWRQMREAARG